MKVFVFLAWLTAAAVGIGLTVEGVRLATGRPRPHNLGGMLLATAGVALALSGLTAAAWSLGR